MKIGRSDTHIFKWIAKLAEKGWDISRSQNKEKAQNQREANTEPVSALEKWAYFPDQNMGFSDCVEAWHLHPVLCNMRS